MTDYSSGKESETTQSTACSHHEIQPVAPDDFGLVQIWWGDGKGKTTAALGLGMRAAGHGYRVHALQFMKGGADSVAEDRGEYGAIPAIPGFTIERAGEYGWHGRRDGTDDEDHKARATRALERARAIVGRCRQVDLTEPIPADDPAETGVHLLICDELLYAVERGLLAQAPIVDFVESKPDDLELVLTGGHESPTYLRDHADLISAVRKDKHPYDEGYPARQGSEY